MPIRVLALVCLSACLGSCTFTRLGVHLDAAVGDVSSHGATVWLHNSANTAMSVTLFDSSGEKIERRRLHPDRYGVTQTQFDGLHPAQTYRVNVAAAGANIEARFKTSPNNSDAKPVQFLFSADLAGQNICRDEAEGFPIFAPMAQRGADFFIALGDMIYADSRCTARGAFGNRQVRGPTEFGHDTDSFIAHWAYSFRDPNFSQLRLSTPYFPVWDDHEVINDFGPSSAYNADAPQSDLLHAGRAAFLAYSPIEPSSAEPNRIYRQLRWGKHVEVFFLDTRQYRAPNNIDDNPTTPKSLLGAEQRRWLVEHLAASLATWKFVVSSVPISIPTGYPPSNGRDGWASGDGASGFEHELAGVIGALADQDVRNIVWLSADVHFATGFELHPSKLKPDYVMHEFIVGPLSAGLFPSEEVDHTFQPTRLYFHGHTQQPKSFSEAKHWFNFGALSIDSSGELELAVINANGKQVAQVALSPR